MERPCQYFSIEKGFFWYASPKSDTLRAVRRSLGDRGKRTVVVLPQMILLIAGSYGL